MAPVHLPHRLPLLKTAKVGMLRTANCIGTCWLASTSIFANWILPLYSSASSSMEGATILQGPHHSAQKSTTIGTADFSSCSLKLESVRTRILSLATVESPFD